MARKCDQTFKVLLHSRGVRAREVLVSALEEPDAHIQERAVSLLTRLHHGEGPSAIVEAFHLLEDAARAEVVGGFARLRGAVRSALRTGRVALRENAVDILAAVGSTDVAPSITGALTDSARSVRRRAAAALLAMAQKSGAAIQSGDDRSRWKEDNAHREVLNAIKTAVRSYAIHGDRRILEAFLLLGEAAHDDLLEVVEAGGAEMVNDFTDILKRDADRLGAGLLVKCLLSESLKVKAAAKEMLAHRRQPQFAAELERYLAGVIGQSGLSLRDGESGGWWAIAVARLAEMSEPFQLKMEQLALSQLKGEARLERLQELMPSRFPSVRREVLLAAQEESGDTSQAIVQSLLADPNEEVQLMATQGVMGWDDADRMEALLGQLRSDYGSVRGIAMTELARVGFDRYRATFDNLDEKSRARAGAALNKIDAGLVERLLGELGALEPERRVRALGMVKAIEKAADVQEEILNLVNDPDKKVRATAVALLGAIGSGEAMKAMILALSDPDRRVQANAIEAFEGLNQPGFADILLPFAASPDSRIRANAVKALCHLKHADAGKHLVAMIRDSSEKVRMSAAWLLGEVNVTGAQSTLERFAGSDPSEAVRAKAREILKKGGGE